MNNSGISSIASCAFEKEKEKKTVIMRKGSASEVNRGVNKSSVTYENVDKKKHFNVNNENEYLNLKNLNTNLSKITLGVKNDVNSVRSPLGLNMVKGNNTASYIHLERVFENSMDNANTKLETLDKILIHNKNKKIDVENDETKERIDMQTNRNMEGDLNLVSSKREGSDVQMNMVPTVRSIAFHLKKPFTDANNVTTSKLPYLKDYSNYPHIEKELTYTSRSSKKEVTNKVIILQKKPGSIRVITQLDDKENLNLTNVHDESDDNNFPFKICFICDQFYLIEKSFQAENCEHSFCIKCGKGYFEEKIEQGDFLFKCPVFKCMKKVNITKIKILVSEKHFSEYEKKDNTKTFSNAALMKQNYFQEPEHKTDNTSLKVDYKTDPVKFYSQKHVLDINTNDTFFFFNKAKEHYCIKCNEPALYGKTGRHLVKCLNCYHTICKFCMKSYTLDHFEITSFNYCRVYFRRKLKKMNINQETKKCKLFLMMFLIFIAGYILFLMGTLKHVSNSITYMVSLKKNSGIFKKSIYFLLLFIFCLIAIPLCLLLIPYFPIIVAIFR